jgi:hypothetical protein
VQSAKEAAVVRVRHAPPGSEGEGGTQRQRPATGSVHRKVPHGHSARVMRVANPVGVVAPCLLGYNVDLRYPGAHQEGLKAWIVLLD